MANTKLIRVVKCNTVGDLLDELAAIAKDPNESHLLDAGIDGPSGDTFDSFKITERTLSDKSKVLDFEFIAE